MIDVEPISIYHSMSEEALVEVNVGAGVASTKGTVPKKEGISTTTNIHMESFFDGADTRAVQPTRPPAQPAQPARTRPAFTRSDCSTGRPRVPISKNRRRRVGFEFPR